MGVEKRLPGGLPLATRGRLNAVFFQGAAHGCIREGIPEVGQGSVDAVIAPGRVFACQPHHQGADLAVIPPSGPRAGGVDAKPLAALPSGGVPGSTIASLHDAGATGPLARFFRAGRAESARRRVRENKMQFLSE
jgi:hypothetical protein